MTRKSTIKLLIVDDSALMRRQLKQVFETEDDFLIKTARNGQEAIDMNLEFEPDVITLDINMPEMDGITALSHIMATRPVPVVMVSSLTDKGALSTFESLALGAVDYVAKPGGTISLSISEIEKTLLQKVRSASTANLKGKQLQVDRLKHHKKFQSPIVAHNRAPKETNLHSMVASKSVIIIGVSTGGPGTLEEIFRRLTPTFSVPIIIAQHMPASFTDAFSQRMNRLYPFNIVEVSRPMAIEPNTVYIARGGADAVVVSRAGRRVILPKPESKNHLWHPSVDLLARSALEHFEAKNIVAVMLTGMGYDGADAFSIIKESGGRTIAESERSSIVFGMPKELIERNGATKVLDAQDIPAQLERWCS